MIWSLHTCATCETQLRTLYSSEGVCSQHVQICLIADRDCRQCAGYVAELRLSNLAPVNSATPTEWSSMGDQNTLDTPRALSIVRLLCAFPKSATNSTVSDDSRRGRSQDKWEMRSRVSQEKRPCKLIRNTCRDIRVIIPSKSFPSNTHLYQRCTIVNQQKCPPAYPQPQPEVGPARRSQLRQRNKVASLFRAAFCTAFRMRTVTLFTYLYPGRATLRYLYQVAHDGTQARVATLRVTSHGRYVDYGKDWRVGSANAAARRGMLRLWSFDVGLMGCGGLGNVYMRIGGLG